MSAETTMATRASRRNRGRRRVTVVGVIGEILLTLGVVTLLYVGWQLWFGDMIYGAQNNAKGTEIGEQWAREYETAAPSPSASDPAAAPPATAEPIAMRQPASGEVFGIMRIPRLGDGYAVPLAGGVGASESLDTGAIGHYPDTDMPGDVGNFAVAAHRGSHGAPFMDLPSLRIGDAVVVETPEGWYTYRFRNLEYVPPSAVDVLLPTPRIFGVESSNRILTMTTCSPRYGFSERVVGYATFDSFTPRANGQPTSLNGVVA